MTCIVLAYVIFKMKLFMPQLRFSNGNFRIGDSIPNNQLVNYVHTCQRLAIIGVTRNTLNDCTCIVLQHIHFEVAWYVISELCLRSANCLLNMFHQIQEFFFQFHNYESGRDAVKVWAASLFLTAPFHTQQTSLSLRKRIHLYAISLNLEVFHNLQKAFLILRKYISVEV